MTPHDIPQTDRWTHVRGEVQAGIVSRAMDDGHYRVDFFKEQVVPRGMED
jgi:hypothetical protein